MFLSSSWKTKGVTEDEGSIRSKASLRMDRVCNTIGFFGGAMTHIHGGQWMSGTLNQQESGPTDHLAAKTEII